MTIFEKKLSKSEIDDYFIHALLFKDQIRKPLRIRIGNNIVETCIDKRGRIWLPRRKIGKILTLKRGQKIRLEYNSDQTYTLTIIT